MVKAKKGKQMKVSDKAKPVKISKEMKANIEKMLEKSYKQVDKRLAAIEKHLAKSSKDLEGQAL